MLCLLTQIEAVLATNSTISYDKACIHGTKEYRVKETNVIKFIANMNINLSVSHFVKSASYPVFLLGLSNLTDFHYYTGSDADNHFHLQAPESNGDKPN